LFPKQEIARLPLSISPSQPQIDKERGQSSLIVPLSLLDPKKKEKEKLSQQKDGRMGGGHANSLYNSRPPNKSRYTSNRRYAIRIQGRTKKETKGKKRKKAIRA
jgi:hypothetical protein